jgi:hypothetical protein
VKTALPAVAFPPPDELVVVGLDVVVAAVVAGCVMPPRVVVTVTVAEGLPSEV